MFPRASLLALSQTTSLLSRSRYLYPHTPVQSSIYFAFSYFGSVPPYWPRILRLGVYSWQGRRIMPGYGIHLNLKTLDNVRQRSSYIFIYTRPQTQNTHNFLDRSTLSNVSVKITFFFLLSACCFSIGNKLKNK